MAARSRCPDWRGAIAALAFCAVPAAATAGAPEIPDVSFRLEDCLRTVLGTFPGRVIGVEFSGNGDAWRYEFVLLRAADRLVWEVVCDAGSGRIVRSERDVALDDPAFDGVSRVPEVVAEAAALRRVPGVVTDREYEVDIDGRAWFEFTIVSPEGEESEVMVDAATGAVLGIDSDREDRLVYRIGVDAD